jgi:hypothetical protein
MKTIAPRGSLVGAALCVLAGWVAVASARADFPEAKSAGAAKELCALLDAKKLDGFAARDGDLRKWVAVSYTSGTRMLAVSMTYDRPGDLEYFLSHKDFSSIYQTLRAAAYSGDGFIVDDSGANGLMPQPKRSQPDDDVLFGSARKTFDGVFNEPKKTDPKKPSFDDYLKTYVDADGRYAHILTVITEELKKGG